MKKNIFKQTWRTFFYRHTTSLTNPLFSWNVSLGLAGLLFLGFLFWSYRIFDDIKSVDLRAVNKNPPGSIVDQSVIKDTINTYDLRTKRFNELTATPETFADPQ